MIVIFGERLVSRGHFDSQGFGSCSRFRSKVESKRRRRTRNHPVVVVFVFSFDKRVVSMHVQFAAHATNKYLPDVENRCFTHWGWFLGMAKWRKLTLHKAPPWLLILLCLKSLFPTTAHYMGMSRGLGLGLRRTRGQVPSWVSYDQQRRFRRGLRHSGSWHDRHGQGQMPNAGHERP